MIINSNINIIGGLPDLSLISYFMFSIGTNQNHLSQGHHAFSSIKTDKSVRRFEYAIRSTFLKFYNVDDEKLTKSILSSEASSTDTLLILFWSMSFNNDLFRFLNKNVYFSSFFGGRIAINHAEVSACLKDLRQTEEKLKGWSDSTINTTASKYLTLLKKFNLLEGSVKKTILHPYLDDKMFLIFIYWLKAVEPKPNLLQSPWLKYSFYETQPFIERVLQKKYTKYYTLNYSGDKLLIETTIPYQNIYDTLK